MTTTKESDQPQRAKREEEKTEGEKLLDLLWHVYANSSGTTNNLKSAIMWAEKAVSEGTDPLAQEHLLPCIKDARRCYKELGERLAKLPKTEE